MLVILQSNYLLGQQVGKSPVVNIPHYQGNTSKKDTSVNKKEPSYFYLAVNTNVFVNTKGGFSKRFSPSLEFGRTYDIFDVGLATGRLSSLSSESDTTRFLEFRPTINIFTKGRFSEALALGAGYVFKAKQSLMTEICNSINFNVSPIWTIAVQQGYYFFDGIGGGRSTQFMGFNLTYNFFKKSENISQQRKKGLFGDN
jgi:hypothetical protein